ncbi:MAG TPA: arylsulfatase [Bacteroidales bacterium]|nr:arylsulfatase [Bacteroidales bacterium]
MNITKSDQIILGGTAILCTVLFSSFNQNKKTEIKKKPNVILIMTDDQGIGDFGFTGNPYVKTPNLDKLASQSLNLTNFYVSPVCAPTRASLMTGRYSERTGVYDTYNGGAIMSNEEITIAEVLKENGYETGIFGKWHLGDNYPYRPSDQGFDVSVVHRAGGMGQPGDILNYFAGDSSYFNPVLFKNDKPVQTKGYCSDIFTEEAMSFIHKNQQEKSPNPFFVYLAFNAPHTPLQLPEEYYNQYKDLQFKADSFAVFDEAVDKMTPAEIEAAKKVYGMVTNIDDNIGKLIQSLKDQNIYNNTILIFLSDNGPQQNRYKLGLRERKSSVYGGGVRVPCLIHYPDKFKEKEELDLTIAHIDLFPSILDLCGISKVGHKIDGLSFISSGNTNNLAFNTRTIFFEWGRGFLLKYRNFAALKGDYKLVGNTDSQSGIENFELFNIKTDPMEKKNIESENVEKATALKNEMDFWYNEIISEKNNRRTFPSYIGTFHENPVLLNRNDAKGTPVAWTQDNVLNYWDVKALEDGIYDISCHFILPINEPGNIFLKMYPHHFMQENTDAIEGWTFKNLEIQKGEYRLEPYYQTRSGNYIFPLYVSVKRMDK